MAFEMSGSYDYTSLRRTLKENGLKENQLGSALRLIASQNNIEDITGLDKTQNIIIPASVFESVATQGVDNPIFTSPFGGEVSGEQNLETLPFIFSSTAPITEMKEQVLPAKIIGDGEDVMKLPEVFNDEDYDVVEYDDYYGFNNDEETTAVEPEETTEAEDDPAEDSEAINYEQFRTQYGSQFVTDTMTSEQEKEDAIHQAFSMLDVNSDQFLSQSELAGMFYSPLVSTKDETDVDTLPTEGEDLLGSDMMSSDMSGDSFNPQG